MKKIIFKNKDVLTAAKERIELIFDSFEFLCLSFSGGKDSTVVFHLMAQVAKSKGRKFSVLFIDWEVQFNATLEFVRSMKETYQDYIDNFYWVCLPLTTVNGVSQIQPEWVAWERDVDWVRQPPGDAIIDVNHFPFYHRNMSFESFVDAFGGWFGNGSGGVVIGIRSDESLNRYFAIASSSKNRYKKNLPWTTKSKSGGGYCKLYPIYDWKLSDVWHYLYVYRLKYNYLYDLMYQAGVPFRFMRICEPFGPEQRRGLWLYKVLEPDVWAKVCARVSGANSGVIYGKRRSSFYSNIESTKPHYLTWKEYTIFLLESMPRDTAEHYKNKFSVYLRWYEVRGYPDDIPDFQDNDCGAKDLPSWRRFCKVIVRNDYWCKMLSFSPTKVSNYTRYFERIKEARKKWGIL